MPKPKKVLMVFNSAYARARGYSYEAELADPEDMYTENDVYQALKANHYDVRMVGLTDSVKPLLEEVEEERPDLIFNLVEVFKGKSQYEKNIGALLETLDIPYTGATSDNLYICNNKGLFKKILSYHKIKVPRFAIFKRGNRVWLPKKLQLPLIVKPMCEEASRGISQASIVDSPKALTQRIEFIHETMKNDALVEEFIEGREMYVSLLGDKKLNVLPIREMKFGELPEDARIASFKAKWDDAYRKKWGIKSVFTGKLPEGLQEEIEDVCKRAYRALDIHSYLRFDIRINAQNQVYIIEPNANPCIAKIDEVALSSAKFGLSYQQLINKIVKIALKRK